MRVLSPFILILVLAGCGAQAKSPDTAATATPSTSASPSNEAVTASQPQEITELTDQKKVYECPKCGMTFDGAGQCSMDGATLVETDVAYLCPADNKAVEKAGKCPRCPMNARVVKTAVAANAETPTSH